MEAIKWLGSIIAAIVLLASMVFGGAIFLGFAGLVTILMTIVIIVGIAAAAIKEWIDT